MESRYGIGTKTLRSLFASPAAGFPRAQTLKLGLLALLLAIVPAIGTAAEEVRRLTVMSYNVENLFDTEDNPSREGDNTYLPKALKGTAAHIALCERNNKPGSRLQECLDLD